MKFTVICPSPGETVLTVGAPGTVRGVADTTLLAAPAPAPLTARIATSYDWPFVKPLIVSGDTVDAGDNAVHVGVPADAFNEYS